MAPRSRLSGGGFKPPPAAVVKSHGGERRGKRHGVTCQVCFRETNVSEPLMRCRKTVYCRQNLGTSRIPGLVRRVPDDCPNGGRHRDGVNLKQAQERNPGTCHIDVKGAIQAADL